MKKIFSLIAVLLTAMVQNICAFEVDGIYYTTSYSGGTYQSYAIVTNSTQSEYSITPSYSGDVIIPSTVEYEGSVYEVKAIGRYAFYGCSDLTSVTIPNSVTSIGSSAFYGCSGLTSVTIPNSVTSIGSSAFEDCSGLTSVTIPNSVTSIGSSAFEDCSGLTSVTIPNSVTRIDDHAFHGCSGLTSVTIPNSVTSIGYSAFYGCSSLTSITIPNSVTRIDYEAFSGCSSLTSVTIPNSVTSIGSSTFYGCSGLTSVTIPNSVTSIGYSAFYGCSSLTSVTIPNSVTSLGNYAFYGCSGLTSVTIPNSVTSISESAFSGCSSLTSVTIPNSVTSIGSNAFYGCSGLTSVTIPNSVTSIGSNAFSGCSGLTSVTIPNSVTRIDYYAFSGCSSLTAVHISDLEAWCNISFYNNGAFANPLYYAHNLYLNGELIKDLVIPDGVQTILPLAFVGAQFSTVTIPESVDSIGELAFYNGSYSLFPYDIIFKSSNPCRITAHNSSTSVSPSFSIGQTLYVPEGSGEAYRNAAFFKNSSIVEGDGNIVNVNITTPGTLGEKIAEQVGNIRVANYLTISGKLNSEDLYVLKERVTDLITLDMSKVDMEVMDYNKDSWGGTLTSKYSLERITLPSNLKKIGAYSFYENYSLKEIIWPENMEEIGQRAFGTCNSLEEIKIPEGVKRLGEDCFTNCRNLKSVQLPSTLTTIPRYCFGSCSNLTSIDFAESIQEIENDAFYGCTSLEEVTLPSTLMFCDAPFYGCSNLKTVKSRAVIPPALYGYKNIFGENQVNAQLHVPGESVENYQKALGWDEFPQIAKLDGNSDYKYFIYKDFTFNSSLQPEKKRDMEIVNVNDSIYGHLTLNTPVAIELKTFSMDYNAYGDLEANGSEFHSMDTRSETLYPTLISNTITTAEDVTVKMQLPVDKWTFISLPYSVNVKDIVSVGTDASWALREYDSSKRAAGDLENTWRNLASTAALVPNKGYIVQPHLPNSDAKAVTLAFPAADATRNNIFAESDKTVEVTHYASAQKQNANWNMVGNPFPCYFDVSAMDYTAPIIIWDAKSGTYKAFSPIDDNYVLLPGEAFFVQCADDVNSITFHAEGRQDNPIATEKISHAKGVKNPTADREVYNLYLKNADSIDKARFVINEEAAADYEMEKDVAKFGMESKDKALLYTIGKGGIKYAINERPKDNGTVTLGMNIPSAGTYTIAMQTRAGKRVVLRDHFTGKTTNLVEDSYTFSASKGTSDSRFTIEIENNATGIEGVCGVSADSQVEVYGIDGKFHGGSKANAINSGIKEGSYILKDKNRNAKVRVAK